MVMVMVKRIIVEEENTGMVMAMATYVPEESTSVIEISVGSPATGLSVAGLMQRDPSTVEETELYGYECKRWLNSGLITKRKAPATQEKKGM